VRICSNDTKRNKSKKIETEFGDKGNAIDITDKFDEIIKLLPNRFEYEMLE
jgi:hypothetical protein